MQIDFGRTSTDYSTHRQGFPDELFTELRRFGIGMEQQQLVDLGTGTGALARAFSKRGAVVTGVDSAAPMIEAARALATTEGLSITWRVAPAEQTGLAAAAFDAVTAGQCWHWFDRPAAALEARRLLRPDGKLMIPHIDWVPSKEGPAALSEALMNRHNPQAPNMHVRFGGGVAIYRDWLGDLLDAGFVDLRTFSFDVPLTYSHEAWLGRCRASQWIGAALPPDAVHRFDDELRALLAKAHPEEPLVIPHRVFAALGTKPR